MKTNFNFSLKVVLVAFLATPSPLAWAAGGRSNQTPTNPNTTTTTTATNPNGTTTTTTNTQNTNTTGTGLNANHNTTIDTASVTNGVARSNLGTNIQQQGQNASDNQGMGQAAAMMGAAFSGMMAAQACSKQPPDPSCPMWILGALASALTGAAMGDAKNTSNQTVADVTSTGSPTPTPVDPTKTPEYVATERNIVESAKKIGAKVDMKRGYLKTADGKTLKAEDLGNMAALQGQGLTQSEASLAQSLFKKAMKEGAKQAAGLDSTKGNQSDEGTSSSIAKNFNSPTVAAEGGGMGAKNRDPAQVAGLSRNYNGEPIGVASENLFTLINRRYDHQAHHNSFLIPVPASTRSQ